MFILITDSWGAVYTSGEIGKLQFPRGTYYNPIVLHPIGGYNQYHFPQSFLGLEKEQ